MDFLAALGIKEYIDDRGVRQEAKAGLAAIDRSRQQQQTVVDKKVTAIHAEFNKTVADLEVVIVEGWGEATAAAEGARSKSDTAGIKAAWEAWAKQSGGSLSLVSVTAVIWKTVGLPEYERICVNAVYDTADAYGEGADAILKGDLEGGLKRCGDGAAVWSKFKTWDRPKRRRNWSDK